MGDASKATIFATYGLYLGSPNCSSSPQREGETVTWPLSFPPTPPALTPTNASPHLQHPTLPSSPRIDVAPSQDVLFLKDNKKKPDAVDYLRVTTSSPTPAELVAVTVLKAEDGGDKAASVKRIGADQFEIRLDTSRLYSKAGVQLLRLRLKDGQGRDLAEKDFRYIVHSKSTQRPDMFARVACEELQHERTWPTAWKWMSHYWVKRCYRDLTGKQKQKSRQGNSNEQPPHEPLPLPPEDVVRRIHRLAVNETITNKKFKDLITWIGALNALYNSADVQALMNLSLLHLVAPDEVEAVLREACEQTDGPRRPTFLLRFSSRPEVLALEVYKGRMLSAAVPMSDHSDRGLRGALVQIMNLLKRPEHEGMLAVLTTTPPYRAYGFKDVEHAIKQLKCMKDNRDLPTNYINPVDVGPALLHGPGLEQKRKRIETTLDSPATTPSCSCPSSCAASPCPPPSSSPPTDQNKEMEEMEEVEEVGRGLVLLETDRAAVVDVLYDRALVDEAVARELYARLHQRFGELSVSYTPTMVMENPYQQEAPLQGGGEDDFWDWFKFD